MNLVLAGGTIYGLAHIGAMRVIINKYKEINEIIGSGIGAFVGTLYNIGYTIDEIEEIFKKINFDKVMKKNGDKYANKLEKKINKLLYNKTGCSKLRFIDMYNNNLTILTFNLNKNKICKMNKINTPYLEVGKAIRMACSFPFIVKPIEYDGNYYIDGMINVDYGLDLLNGNKIAIHLKLLNYELNEITNYKEYVEYSIYLNYNKNINENAMIIDIPYKWNKFDLSNKEKQHILNISMEIAHDWINKNNPSNI